MYFVYMIHVISEKLSNLFHKGSHRIDPQGTICVGKLTYCQDIDPVNLPSNCQTIKYSATKLITDKVLLTD